MNIASYDNYMLINSYLTFCFLLFSMTTLLQLGVFTFYLNSNIQNFFFSRRLFAKSHTISSWCRIFSSRSRSGKIRILSILKFFVHCCHSDIDFTKKWPFDKLHFVGNHWCKVCSDRTRIKSLLGRLENIGMVSEKLYRNTLRLHYR